MIAVRYILFYSATFLAGFGFGFPVGPCSLEMLRTAWEQARPKAWFIALGGATANAAWATAALIGIRPLLKLKDTPAEGFIFLLAALVCAVLGLHALHTGNHPAGDCTQVHQQKKRGKRRDGWIKGFSLGVSYPLTVGSWMIILAFLRKMGWTAPPGPWNAMLFFLIVFSGYFSYQAVLMALSRPLFEKFFRHRPAASNRLTGFLLLSLSLLFVAFFVHSWIKHHPL